MRHRTIAFVTALMALSCRQDFPPSWKIVGLRVITVTLDPPYIAPGETSHVHVLAVDTNSRPITMHWSACPPTTGSLTPTNFRCDSPLAMQGEGASSTSRRHGFQGRSR